MNSENLVLLVINLIISTFTAIGVLFIVVITLKQNAKPHIRVRMLTPNRLNCNTATLFKFDFKNIGHWYGSPPSIDTNIFVNFAPEFQLTEIRYGSVQEYVNSEVKVGVGNMLYLKAKGLKLPYGEESEEVHVVGITPSKAGTYLIRITGLSVNGASFVKEFKVSVISDAA